MFVPAAFHNAIYVTFENVCVFSAIVTNMCAYYIMQLIYPKLEELLFILLL